MCNKLINKGEKLEHFNCFRNYSGSSTGMESFMAVKGVKELKENHEIEVNEIINDGDSRSYNALI